MLLYILASAIGFVLAKIIYPTIKTSPFFEDVVMNNLRQGKRVAIVVDEDATIFEMTENRMRIVRGKADFFKEYDNVIALDGLQSDESSGIDSSVH